MKLFVLIMVTLIAVGCAAVSPPNTSITVYRKDSGTVQTPSGRAPQAQKPAPPVVSTPPASDLAVMGYTIQAGAFRQVDNAAAFTEQLEKRGLNPYYFKDDSGLYKVRFGNYGTKEAAHEAAVKLHGQRIIDDFYIVTPGDYTVTKAKSKGSGGAGYIRGELVKSARKYIGVPYKWGGNGTSGIDCSGLTQAVYNLNGLDIPRNSRAQYSKGAPVDKKNLQPGDLVFFATSGGRTVSHVGIYIGNSEFIHAPSSGKKVSIAKLSDPYFTRAYVGGRNYL